jgi:hypothetical protein
MAEGKQQRPMYRSPRSRFLYVFVTGEGRDYKGNGKFEYSLKAVVPAGAEADTFQAQLDKIAADGLAGINAQLKEKSKPPKKALNFDLYERDAESNDLLVKFKCPTKITSRKTGETYPNKVRFFDAGGNPVEGELKIGNGTQGRVIFGAFPWVSPIGCGVRLEPKALHVLEFVEFTGGGGARSAADFGIEAEDGYTFDAGTEGDEEEVSSVGAGEV